MTEQPWLSVIMPSYNGQRWLAEALQSVADQNTAGIEVIFVDGSETDACRTIAEGFRGRLDIAIHSRPDLRTWTAKTNFALAEARGEWISMLHTDDLWLPGRCLALREWLPAYPDAAMHLHPAYFIDGAGRRVGRWRCPLPTGPAPCPPELLFERLLVQNFVAIPTPAIRRDAMSAIGGLDEALWHTADWDLYLKVAGRGSVYYHAAPLAGFRIHNNSLTVTGSRSLADYREQHRIVTRRHADRLPAGSRATTLRLAGASVEVNAALAAANNGRPGALIDAAGAVLALGSRLMLRYLRYSRIAERLLSRLRARLSGGL
jgi:glycosyltransferase involved in cell wall biosynthesis